MKFNSCRLVLIISIIYFLAVITTTAAQPSPPSSDAYLNPSFKPSVSVTIIVLIGAFFFIVFFSIYVRQCSNEARGSVLPSGAVGARPNRVGRGLAPEVIEKFPTFDYSMVKGLKIGKGALECAVCLNEFEDDEKLRLLPKCDHVFHPECIDAWLASHTTCPVCRADLVTISEEAVSGADTATDGSIAPAGEVQLPLSVSDTNPNLTQTNESEVIIMINDEDSAQSQATQQPAAVTPGQLLTPNRPPRSKSVRNWIAGRFPRSHSTGHSVGLVRPGENIDRFTLRLPAEIRKDIMNGKLSRTTSCLVVPTRQGSVSGVPSIRQGSSTRWRSFNFRRSFNFGRSGRAGSKSASDRWGLSFWKSNFAKKGDDDFIKFVGNAECGPDYCSTSKSPV